MELEMIKQEIKLLKIRSPMTDSASCTIYQTHARVRRSDWLQSKVNINTIAEFLPESDSMTGDFCIWQNQLRFLERTYRLNAEPMKILIGLRGRRKALAWLLKTEHMELSMEDFLSGLKTMFDYRPNRIMLHEKFQKRKWERSESFSDYMH
ncbi:hypothetical protein HN011_005534 [Eciton burchellii]|nr:hypothetical protein HN011_005534 [Eciton burchellii]